MRICLLLFILLPSHTTLHATTKRQKTVPPRKAVQAPTTNPAPITKTTPRPVAASNTQTNNISTTSPQMKESIYHATYPFSLPALPYAYNALEPHIDERTMNIHHNKHHQGYVDNLNKALKDHPTLHKKTLFELLSNLSALPASIRDAVRNHGGGHFNHSLFWRMMAPNALQAPTGTLAKKIKQTFGSFEAFQEQFNKAAKSVFGSGWAWLVTDSNGNLRVIATHNQDSPVSNEQIPLLGLDVWEHAYYLKYQNQRSSYIDAWWHVINWPQVASYYEQATRK